MCKYVCEKLCVRTGGGGGGGRDDEGDIMVSEVNMEEDAYEEEEEEDPALSEKLKLVVVVVVFCGALRLSRMEVAYIAARWTPSNPAKRSSVVAPQPKP